MRGRSGARRQIYRAALQLFAERGDAHVTISELAQVAGVARGTIYNRLGNPRDLFEVVAAEMASELNARLVRAVAGIDDSPQRMALALRLCLRRAHEEPQWGRFLCRFGCTTTALQGIWRGEPLANLKAGMADKRYCFPDEQIDTVISLVSGGTIAAIVMVLDGTKTWRDAGSELAELVLVALGLDRAEARHIARAPLPEPLP